MLPLCLKHDVVMLFRLRLLVLLLLLLLSCNLPAVVVSLLTFSTSTSSCSSQYSLQKSYNNNKYNRFNGNWFADCGITKRRCQVQKQCLSRTSLMSTHSIEPTTTTNSKKTKTKKKSNKTIRNDDNQKEVSDDETTTTTTSICGDDYRKLQLLLDQCNSIIKQQQQQQQDEDPTKLSIPMNENDALIIRQCMDLFTSLLHQSNDNDTIITNNVENIHLLQKILFCMIDQYKDIVVRDHVNDDDDSTLLFLRKKVLPLITPCTQHFITVMKCWENCIRQYDLNQQQQIAKKRSTTTATSTTHQVAIQGLIDTYESFSDLLYNVREIRFSLLQPKHLVVELFEIFFQSLATPLCYNERGIDQIVWKYFQEIKHEYKIVPTVLMYHSMIVITAKSRVRGASNRAETLLREAVQYYPPTIHHDNDGTTITTTSGITIDSFNVVLTAWAKSGMEYSYERAEQLIAYIDEIDNKRHIIQPTVTTFTSLIDSYAQTNDWDNICHAERIFNRVLDMHLVESSRRTTSTTTTTTRIGSNSPRTTPSTSLFEPGIVAWTILMNAWARLSKKGHRGAVERVDKLFRRMIALYNEQRISFEPDSIVYVTCMNAHALYNKLTIDNANTAKELLVEMYEKYLDGNDTFQPTIRSIQIVINSYIKLDRMDLAQDVLDQFHEYIQELLRTTTTNDENQNNDDDTVVQENEQQHLEQQVYDLYKSMIFAYAKNGKYPQQAQKLLFDMIKQQQQNNNKNGLYPDTTCYDRVMDSYIQNGSSSSKNGFMKHTYDVFHMLEQCRIKGYVQPNERTYVTFIRAMIKANVPQMAFKSYSLLQRMKVLSSSSSSNNNSNNNNDYNQRQQQHQHLLQPTVHTYNAVLLACSESTKAVQQQSDCIEAYDICQKLYQELLLLLSEQSDINANSNGNDSSKNTVFVDHVTFGNMLRCTNLVSAIQKNTNNKNNDDDTATAMAISSSSSSITEQEELINSIFQTCCTNGYVNAFVLRDLRNCRPASNKLWYKLFQSKNVEEEVIGDNNDDETLLTLVEQLPQMWTRNTMIRQQQQQQIDKNIYEYNNNKRMSRASDGRRHERKRPTSNDTKYRRR